MKKILLLLFSLVFVLGLVACQTAEAPATPVDETGEMEFTLEELAQYNGEDGNKAYVAVDGVVYDVTDSNLWSGGAHNGYGAGRDLTEEIKTVSPHGVSTLERMPVVGRIIE